MPTVLSFFDRFIFMVRVGYLLVNSHLNSIVFRNVDFLTLVSLFPVGNTFQNLSVSSPAPVTIVCPEGFIAKNNTLLVCPVKVVTFSKLGYFQTII
jgi:hypothetical protein